MVNHTDPVRALIALAERAVPFLLDEAANYDDDGSNEPLELARDIESLVASLSSDESALPSANSAFDGGREAAPCPHAREVDCDCANPPVLASAPPSGAAAYCRECQAVGMSNCAHFDECAGAACVTCHRPLNVSPPSAPGLLADLETIWHSVSDDGETNAAYQRLQAAIAQQPTDPVRALIALAERAVPFLLDEAANYDDDGSNEPLELAREIESVLAELAGLRVTVNKTDTE